MSGERKIDRSFCDEIGQGEAEAEIDRLLADSRFQSPERNKSFLRFIAAEFFEGRTEAIKAYAIAVDVFGRPANFDPSVDPIVRIEATRLRAALTQYYDAHGSDTGIRVDLPRGRYVPVFTRMPANNRSSLPAEAVEPDVPGKAPSVGDRSAQRFIGGRTGLTLTGMLVGIGIATYALTIGLNAWKQNTLKHKPLISISLSSDGDAPERDVEKVRDYLAVAISQFQTVRLASSRDPTVTASMGEGPGPTLVASLRGQRLADDYHVVLKYEGKGLESFVWWQVKDASNGEVLLSGIEQALGADPASLSPTWSLANGLARTLVGTHGVINTIETLRELDVPSLGNGCVLRAIAASNRGDVTDMTNARGCLERTLVLAPNDAGAKAELAIVLLALDSIDVPTDLSARARTLASEAVKLSPFSDRSKYALMISQFRAGQIQLAIETGYAAMALNPNNSDIAARLGLYLFTAGRWEEGADLAARSAQMDHNLAADGLLTRALNAYRLGRFEEALAIAQQLKLSDGYVAHALQAAAAGQLDRADDAKMALASLGTGRADFDVVFRKSMAARYFTPEMTSLIEIGVLKAAALKS